MPSRRELETGARSAHRLTWNPTARVSRNMWSVQLSESNMSTKLQPAVRQIGDNEKPLMVDATSVGCGFLLFPKKMAGILQESHVHEALQTNKTKLWEAVRRHNPRIPVYLMTTNQEIGPGDAVVALDRVGKYPDYSIALDPMQMSPDGGRNLRNDLCRLQLEIEPPRSDCRRPAEDMAWKVSVLRNEKVVAILDIDSEPSAENQTYRRTVMSFWKKLFGDKKNLASFAQLTAQQSSPPSLPPASQAASAAGANINAKDANGRTALIEAADKGDLNRVNSLIAAGADVNARESDGGNALISACAGGHHEVVQALLGNGADINASAKNNRAALHYASAIGNREVVKTLVDKGADINAKDEDGLTALMLAAAGGHREVVQTLVDKGADVDAELKDGRTAGLLALQNMHPEIMHLLAGMPDIPFTSEVRRGSR